MGQSLDNARLVTLITIKLFSNKPFLFCSSAIKAQADKTGDLPKRNAGANAPGVIYIKGKAVSSNI
jgi:hypothetical protein